MEEKRKALMAIILKLIKQSEPHGMGVMDLCKKMDLNKETVGVYCMELQKKGLITRKSKVEKYHLTGRVGNFPQLIPFSIGTQAYRKITDWEYVSLNGKFYNNNTTFIAITKKLERLGLKYMSGSSEVDELVLFEWANRIGAFILYNLIQAMNPRPNIHFSKFNTNQSITDSDDEFAMMWIENAINPGIMLHEFSVLEIVQRGIKSDKESYLVNKKVWNDLIGAFKRLYPQLFDELEQIKKDVTTGPNNQVQDKQSKVPSERIRKILDRLSPRS